MTRTFFAVLVAASFCAVAGTHSYANAASAEVSTPASGGQRGARIVNGTTTSDFPTGPNFSGVAPMTMPASGSVLTDTLTYELFFSRLSWILREGVEWWDCGELDNFKAATGAWGTSEPLCLLVRDSVPHGVVRCDTCDPTPKHNRRRLSAHRR